MSDDEDGLVSDAIDFAADIVITVDERGRISSWNDAAVRVLGFSYEEAIDQSLALVVPERYRPHHIAGFQAAMASGHLQHDGYPALVEATAKNGQLVPLEMTLGLLPGGAHGATGAVAILRRAATTPISFI